MSTPRSLTPAELDERDNLAFELEQSATARRQAAAELVLLRLLLQAIRHWRTRPRGVQKALDRIPLRSARAEWDLLSAEERAQSEVLL